MKTYNLFISHSWKYDDAYTKFVNLLNMRGYFDFKNYSVPPENPIVGARTDSQLSEAIENKIRPSSVVIIMAGVYSTHSKWMAKEIAIAKRLGKPIIAVKPFASTKISAEVREAANEVCNWSTESIISAIRRWA
jgi:hypothetical protein